jgi:hypothetical protein
MRTRDEVRTVLDSNFKALMDCLSQLTEEELTENVVAGSWTAKDILAHVWDWGDEAVNAAHSWRSPRSSLDEVALDDTWNETHVAAKRILPLITVVDGLTATHHRLMLLLDTSDDEMLAQVGRAPWGEEMPLIDMIYEMAVHYADHAGDLTDYQERCLGTEEDRKSHGCE